MRCYDRFVSLKKKKKKKGGGGGGGGISIASVMLSIGPAFFDFVCFVLFSAAFRY